MADTQLLETPRVAYGWHVPEEYACDTAQNPLAEGDILGVERETAQGLSEKTNFELIWCEPLESNGPVAAMPADRFRADFSEPGPMRIAVEYEPPESINPETSPVTGDSDFQSILSTTQTARSIPIRGGRPVYRLPHGGLLYGERRSITPINPKIQEIFSQVQQYVIGVDRMKPPQSAVSMALHFVDQAIRRSYKTEIDFDEEDGTLLFDLRLLDGLLLMAELYHDGTLYLGVHDDRGEGYSKLVKWLEYPSEQEITEIFSEAKWN